MLCLVCYTLSFDRLLDILPLYFWLLHGGGDSREAVGNLDSLYSFA